MNKGLLVVATLLATLSVGQGAINVVAPTTGTAGSLTITQDITLTIAIGHAGPFAAYLVLDEWVTSDGTYTQSATAPLTLSINSGVAQTYNSNNFTNFLADNLAAATGAITANDGMLSIGGTLPALVVNDTVTLKTGTYVLAPTSGSFNPQATKSFTGNAFLVDGTGAKFSNTVAVPEPATSALVALAGVVLLAKRRRVMR